MVFFKSLPTASLCLFASVFFLQKSRSLKRCPYLTLLYRVLLKARWSKFKILKFTFNAKNFIRSLSWSACNHFVAIYSSNMRHSLKSQKKPLKPSIFGVQGRSRSSSLMRLVSLSQVFVMLGRNIVPTCSLFYAKQANSDKITTFKGYPFLTPLFEGNLEISSPTGTKFCHEKNS